jgi:hypothetical protein
MMRAPSPSFRSEIAAYRGKLLADNEGHPELSAWLALLDRWSDYAGAEQIWGALKTKVPPERMLTGEELIYLVLNDRFNLLEPLNRVVDGLPEIERKVVQRTKRHLKEGKHGQIATENGLLQKVLNSSERILGREKRTAVRNRFISNWTTRFTEVCGQPLDDVVRQLAEIAFGKAVTLDTVRGTRKARKTTD